MYNGRWMYSSWGFYDGVENVSFFSLFYEWNSGIVFNMFSVGFYFLSFLREVRKKGRFKRWKFWESWFSFFHFLRYLIRVLCIIKFFHERYFCNWEYDSTGKCWSKKKKKNEVERIRSRGNKRKIKRNKWTQLLALTEKNRWK